MTTSSLLTLLAFGALSISAVAAAGDAKTTPATIRFDTCSRPEWPRHALGRNETGTVTLKFLVDEQGKVIDSMVRKSSGSTGLDEAARQAIARCMFTPPTHNGHAIQTWATMQYVWSIDDKHADDKVAEANALRAAGAKGDMDALFKLSKMYQGGGRIKQDLAASATLLQLAANRNHPEAAAALAQQYEFGTHGRTKDPVQAGIWYLKAAELGVAEAQHKVGTSLLGAGEAAQGAAWMRKAAEQGHAMAAYELAKALDQGKGGLERDPAGSLRLLRMAAAKEHSKARHALAVALLRAPAGPADVAEAVRWLETAAADRQGDAELLLAELKLEGKAVARDETAGMQLLRRAADGGNIPAMSILGAMLERGLLTPRDAGESARWTARAARYGGGEPPYSSGYIKQLLAAR